MSGREERKCCTVQALCRLARQSVPLGTVMSASHKYACLSYHCVSHTNIGSVIADRLLALTDVLYSTFVCKSALLLRPGVLLLLLIFAASFRPFSEF